MPRHFMVDLPGSSFPPPSQVPSRCSQGSILCRTPPPSLCFHWFRDTPGRSRPRHTFPRRARPPTNLPKLTRPAKSPLYPSHSPLPNTVPPPPRPCPRQPIPMAQALTGHQDPQIGSIVPQAVRFPPLTVTCWGSPGPLSTPRHPASDQEQNPMAFFQVPPCPSTSMLSSGHCLGPPFTPTARCP